MVDTSFTGFSDVPIIDIACKHDAYHIDIMFAVPPCMCLRLALLCILNCRPDDFLVVAGLLCRSFVAINRGTNKRQPYDALGDVTAPSVIEGNFLLCRTMVKQHILLRVLLHSILYLISIFQSICFVPYVDVLMLHGGPP